MQQRLKITVLMDQTTITRAAKREHRMKARYNKRQKLDETVQESLESDLQQPFECNEVIVENEQPEAIPEPFVPYVPAFHDMMTQSAYKKKYFLISQPNHTLWVLKRIISMRQFFRAPKTYVKIDG